ncbi:hypothetical protein Bbelb_101240 [Branchiostoma belcheri]|nr:hypothetical protein Bbelb_101240 [Branchiostoma belcheri]
MLSSNASCPGEQTIRNCSRPTLTFTEEEFDVLSNGSVHLLSSNVTCPAEQVAILNTTAFVCGECILQYFLNSTNNDQATNNWEATQGWLTLGLVIVSVIAVCAFIGYTIKSGEWKKVPTKLKVQMLACMAVGESLFVARVLPPPGVVCAVYGIILHYFLLTAFTSMNALALDIFFTFRDGSERPKLRSYVLHTWLMPLLVVTVTVFVEFCPCSSVSVEYGVHCWIGNPTGSRVLGYIFIVLNASQGFLLALLMTMTGEVLQSWASVIRARIGLGEPSQGNGPTAGSQQTAPCTSGIAATGSSAATEDIPMTTFVDVEENKAKAKPESAGPTADTFHDSTAILMDGDIRWVIRRGHRPRVCWETQKPTPRSASISNHHHSTAAAAVDTLFPPQDEPELAPPQTRTTYSKQKIATQESWNNVRDDLFNLMKVTVNAAKIWTRN